MEWKANSISNCFENHLSGCFFFFRWMDKILRLYQFHQKSDNFGHFWALHQFSTIFRAQKYFISALNHFILTSSILLHILCCALAYVSYFSMALLKYDWPLKIRKWNVTKWEMAAVFHVMATTIETKTKKKNDVIIDLII